MNKYLWLQCRQKKMHDFLLQVAETPGVSTTAFYQTGAFLTLFIGLRSKI